MIFCNGKEVLANRPDIIVANKKYRTFLLIDAAIPSDRSVIQKKAEKKLKYKNLSTEIQLMSNMKCFVMPVITGTTGIVSKSLQKYLEKNTRTTLNRFLTNKLPY
jgi:hypothetical protein